MHARIEDLISLRDDEPVDAALATHVAGCETCARELHRLRSMRERMRQLPTLNPPLRLPDLPVVQAVDPPRRVMRTRRWLPYAAAVSAALAVLTLVWSLAARAPSSNLTVAVDDSELNSLVTRSQQLEALLQDMPPRPAVEQAAMSATIEALQARIQFVDSQLLDPRQVQRDDRELQQLWGERVLLMNSLLGMRYAEATRVGYVPNNRQGEL